MAGGRPGLRLDWSEESLRDLAVLAEWMPAACRRAVAEMERMTRSGFNYGRRLTSQQRLWYWPAQDVGVYYEATPTTLRVVRVVDARRLRALP